MYSNNDYRSYALYHHGILGQKWGIRRYQNADGTLTEEGKKKYGSSEHGRKKLAKYYSKELNRADSLRARNQFWADKKSGKIAPSRFDSWTESKQKLSANIDYEKEANEYKKQIKKLLSDTESLKLKIDSAEFKRQVTVGRAYIYTGNGYGWKRYYADADGTWYSPSKKKN